MLVDGVGLGKGQVGGLGRGWRLGWFLGGRKARPDGAFIQGGTLLISVTYRYRFRCHLKDTLEAKKHNAAFSLFSFARCIVIICSQKKRTTLRLRD